MPANSLKIKVGCLAVCLSLLTAVHAEAFVYQDRIATSKSVAHYAMGYIYDLLGLTNRAVLEYQKAAQFDEASYLIRLRLGTNYARLNMLNEAINELNLVKQYNPEELQSHYLLALIYSTQKEYDKAAEEYEIILKSFSEIEPQNIEIYGYLGQLYYSQRKYDQAIEQFEKILTLEPKNTDVLYLLGSLYLEIDQNDRSIELLKRALDVEPDHDGSLNTLGYLYAERGENLDEAQSLIERALEISPDNGAYLDSLGWVHYQKGNYEKALTLLREAGENLEDPVIYEHLGDVHFKLNNYDEALENWERSLELQPNQEQVLNKIEELSNIQASR